MCSLVGNPQDSSDITKRHAVCRNLACQRASVLGSLPVKARRRCPISADALKPISNRYVANFQRPKAHLSLGAPCSDLDQLPGHGLDLREAASLSHPSDSRDSHEPPSTIPRHVNVVDAHSASPMAFTIVR